MNKKTKLWLGIGVVAAAAYYFWNKSKSSTTKVNQSGSDSTYSVSAYKDPYTACPSGYSWVRHNTVVVTCKSKSDGSIKLVGRNK